MIEQIPWLLWVWLQELPVLAAWLAMVAIVLGAGRSAGLPLLFWHERPGPAFLAGLSATMLTAETFFVLYLIHSDSPHSATLGLAPQMAVGGGLWLVVVVARTLQLARVTNGGPPAGGRTSRRSAKGLTPRIHAVAPGAAHLGDLTAIPISPWPFLLGVVAGIALMVAWLLIDHRLFASRPNHVHLHVMAATVSGLLLAVFWLVRRHAIPALGLCMLLALLVGAYGFVVYWTGSRALPLLASLGLLWFAGRSWYHLRLPVLADRYPKRGTPAPYPPLSSSPKREPEPALLLDRLTSAEGNPGAGPEAPLASKRPIVLICASGGGIRSAAWTAAVLGRLDALPGFRPAAGMLTGASGGMVGASYWVAWRHAEVEKDPRAGLAPAAKDDWKNLLACVASDSLTATARRLFFRDIPMAFWPGANLHDRGRALEDAWIAAAASGLGARLNMPIAALRDGEARGFWPSLVFSPMLIEDGRRLVMSNLGLRDVLLNQAMWLGAAGAAGTLGTSSVTAYHCADLFPEEWGRFPLSTAARLSAAFPYVSPAVVLPTLPRRRVVDAGYYDNYGMDLLCNWLREALTHNRPWLSSNVSGILVIQIRDNVSDLSINPESATERQQARLSPRAGVAAESIGSALSRGLEGLTSPPSGLLAARDSVMLFRNDAQLETVTEMFHRSFGRSDFVTTAVFEFKGEASLSWYLTRGEIEGMTAQADVPAIQSKIDSIGEWLTTHLQRDE